MERISKHASQIFVNSPGIASIPARVLCVHIFGVGTGRARGERKKTMGGGRKKVGKFAGPEEQGGPKAAYHVGHR